MAALNSGTKDRFYAVFCGAASILFKNQQILASSGIAKFLASNRRRRRPGNEELETQTQLKETYALDNIRDFARALAFGPCQLLHPGWLHPHSARSRCRRSHHQFDSGQTNAVSGVLFNV
jgi:hypothetical protein